MRRIQRMAAAGLLTIATAAAGATAWNVSHTAPDTSQALPGTVHAVPPPVATSPAVPAPSEVARVPGMGRSAPVRIVIPAIGVDAPVMPMTVALTAKDGSTPPLGNHNLAGWFSRTVAPGQAGTSVINGHVDSYTGPSVFYSLKNLTPGERIMVHRADGSVAAFHVTWVQVASKTSFPWGTLTSPSTYPRLILVTCGGAFDRSTGHYVDNIIVYARS